MVGGEGKLPRIALIPRVSPSRAFALICCPLAEAFRSAATALKLPTHPKAHFGILVHEFFAIPWGAQAGPTTEQEVKQIWNDGVNRYEKLLSGDPHEASVLPLNATCDDFEVNSILAVKAAFRIRENAKGSSGSARKETDFVSEDGLIAGRLDKVSWDKSGAATITDVKTGKATDSNGNIRDEIVAQLKLYAYLLYERDGVWPVSVCVQPLSGEKMEVKFTLAEAEGFANEVRKKLGAANQMILGVADGTFEETQLANPSPSNCRFCAYRISCSSYWAARKLWLGETAAPDLEGVLSAVTEQAGGFCFLGFDTHEGSATVRGFRPQFVRGNDGKLKIGQSTRVCEMRRERPPRTFSCRPMTVLSQI